MLVTSANELVICVFGSLDLGTTKSKSCLFREMCRYDDNEGEERRSGGEVKREAGVSCAMDGKETTVYSDVRVRHVVETFPERPHHKLIASKVQ